MISSPCGDLFPLMRGGSMLPGDRCCPCGRMSIPYEHPWVQPGGRQHPRTPYRQRASSAPWPWTFGGSSLCGSSSILATQAHLLCQQPSPNRQGTISLACQSSATMQLQRTISPPKTELKAQIAGRHHTEPLPCGDGLSPHPFFPSSSRDVHPMAHPTYFSLWVGEFT